MTAAADELVIAIAKGRILEEAVDLLSRTGIVPKDDPLKSRKLVIATSRPDIKFVIIRAADVPTYVEYGAADLGITGKDVLLEHDGNDLYEPLDLGIARCRLMLAGRQDRCESTDRPRIATKYPNTTRRFFAAKGVQVEVIKLYGSMELAPLSGLADKIVDLVDTGNTLKANGLIAEEKLCDISSRLVVNKAAMKIKNKQIQDLIRNIEAVVAGVPAENENV